METKNLFDKQKAQTLKTDDLSRKGSFDSLINDFLTKLNEHTDYFTLSSCSGRIVLLKAEKVLLKRRNLQIDTSTPLGVGGISDVHFHLRQFALNYDIIEF